MSSAASSELDLRNTSDEFLKQQRERERDEQDPSILFSVFALFFSAYVNSIFFIANSRTNCTIYLLVARVTVHVKTLMGRSAECRVRPSSTVEHLKQEIERLHSIPVSQQRLFHLGKELLAPSKSLSLLGIKHDSTIYIVFKLPS